MSSTGTGDVVDAPPERSGRGPAPYARQRPDQRTVLPRRAAHARPRARHPVRRAVLALLLVGLALLGWSVGHALTLPGTDSVAARLAEWGRDHHLSWLVNAGERLQYRLHPPATGGVPSGLPTAPPRPSGVTVRHAPVVRSGVHLPAAVPSLAGAALPGEGQWQTLLTVNGHPALQAAYVRPDRTHTRYLTGIAWLDPRLVRLELHPGTVEPGGGGWTLPSRIPPDAREGLLATFNSGFRLKDSRGGYYAEGRTMRPLRSGAASLVLRADGSFALGQWDRDVRMEPGVVAVRQNLDLIVDDGHAAAGIDAGNSPKWGYTLGNKLFVWRSALGVTRDGALLYVAGNTLTARTLSNVLVAAGAVRAMELDINPEWTSFSWFSPDQGGGITAHKLTPDEQRPANRYFATSTRDFFAVRAR